MTTLIFDTILSGHHLEYLHHFYVGALERKEESFILLVPKEFEDIKDKFDWPNSGNISISYFTTSEEEMLSKVKGKTIEIASSKILAKKIKEYKADKVILTMLSMFIPFIIYLVSSNVQIRGILYKVYLYEKHTIPFLKLLMIRISMFLIARSRVIESIFILNDNRSAAALNKIYKTNKFKFLPDPVPEIDFKNVHDIRTELNIPKSHKLFIHIGAMDQRKGTLDILKSIILSDRKNMENSSFVFAGKINDSCRREFYTLLEDAKNMANIIVFDEFCTYDFLYNLCYSCDVILMPYKTTNLSSGILGYAASFNKPVIGPGDGLIGNLINEHRLGYTITHINPYTLLNSYSVTPVISGKGYCKKSTISSFISKVYE